MGFGVKENRATILVYSLTSSIILQITDQIANIRWIIEKARQFQKKQLILLYWHDKAFHCVDHNELWKILQKWEYQTTWSASWEICMQVRKQQLELDMEQQTGSK